MTDHDVLKLTSERTQKGLSWFLSNRHGGVVTFTLKTNKIKTL